MTNKKKNTIMLLVGLILIVYAGLILILPMYFNNKLHDKTIIRPFEDLLNLKIDYADKSKISIKPNFDVYVNMKEFDVNKPGIDMHVAKAGDIKMVLSFSSLFTKNYNLKSLSIKNVTFDHVLDYDKSEITNYFQQYTKLPDEGSKYSVKTCDVKIKNLLMTQFAHPQEQYSEKIYEEKEISALEFADYITKISDGTVKVSY